MKASPAKQFFAVLLTCHLATAFTLGGINVVKNAPEDDAKRVIAAYRTDEPNALVHLWQAEITHPNHNPKYKEFLDERLREWEKTEFALHRLNDPQLVTKLREVILPVLRLYNRQDCFEIIIIDHPIPVMMNDSGVILMVSTGLLKMATSDDELLGQVAHELGHDLLWRRTASARQVLEIYERDASIELQAEHAREEMAKIEFEADAFAAVSVASLGRNPLPYARYLEKVDHDFVAYAPPYMPLTALRVRVIEGVVPAYALRVPPQTTENFKKLKAELASHL